MDYKSILHTTFKLVIVGVVSATIAYLFNLRDYLLVGMLGILSISLTKKDTILNGVKRYLDVLLGLLLGTIIFLTFGYVLYSLLIFLVLYILLSYIFKIEIGLIPGLVLVRYVYQIGSFETSALLSEIGMISIALIVAVLINLVYPEFSMKQIRKSLSEIDQMLRDHLFMLSLFLIQKDHEVEIMKHHQLLNERILIRFEKVEKEDKNLIFSNDHRFLAYLYMRQNQLNYINQMYDAVKHIQVIHPYMEKISIYIKELVSDIGTGDKSGHQQMKLDALKQSFKNEALPETREAFETRALLYQMILMIESMLELKSRFHVTYPRFII